MPYEAFWTNNATPSQPAETAAAGPEPQANDQREVTVRVKLIDERAYVLRLTRSRNAAGAIVARQKAVLTYAGKWVDVPEGTSFAEHFLPAEWVCPERPPYHISAWPASLAELRPLARENPVIAGGLRCLPANPTPADTVAALSAIICILDTERTALYARLAETAMCQPPAPITYTPSEELLLALEAERALQRAALREDIARTYAAAPPALNSA